MLPAPSPTLAAREDDPLPGREPVFDLDVLVVREPEPDWTGDLFSGRVKNGDGWATCVPADGFQRHLHHMAAMGDDDVHAHVHAGLQAGDVLKAEPDRKRDDAAVLDSRQPDELHHAGEGAAAQGVYADHRRQADLDARDVEFAQVDIDGEALQRGDRCHRSRRVHRGSGTVSTLVTVPSAGARTVSWC